MPLVDRIAVWLTLIIALLALYFALKTIHESRDISLESEEHHVLMELASSISANSLVGTQQLDRLLEDYEDARWDAEVHERIKDSRPMRFLMHGNLRAGSEAERYFLSKHSQFLRAQLQKTLAQTIPNELEEIVNLSDEQIAARRLEKLLVIGYYAHRFDSWDSGKKTTGNPGFREKAGAFN